MPDKGLLVRFSLKLDHFRIDGLPAALEGKFNVPDRKLQVNPTNFQDIGIEWF